MGVTVAVAILAADVCPCVDNGDILLDVVHVANVAATIISYGFVRQADIRVIIKQQRRPIIRFGFLGCFGFRACLRLVLDLCLLTRGSHNKSCRQNKYRETVFHIFYYSSSLSGKVLLLSLIANS